MPVDPTSAGSGAWRSAAPDGGALRRALLVISCDRGALLQAQSAAAALKVRFFRFSIVPCRIGPAQGGAVPPILPSAKGALARASHQGTLDKIGTPAPRLRGAFGVLDPARSGIVRPSVFKRKERTMTLYDHIQELRAELRGCRMTRGQRLRVEAELATAIAEQAQIDRSFDRALDALGSSSRRAASIDADGSAARS
jgi:hypothetical protein